LLDLDKTSTWEEKLDVCATKFPKEANISLNNIKCLATTIYDHIVAIQQYEKQYSRLKLPIILLKPTDQLTISDFTEEDYGLQTVVSFGLFYLLFIRIYYI